MDPAHHRPLLPRGGEPLPPGRSMTVTPKRAAVYTACEYCRQKKSRCDGARPQCAACAAGGRECVYSTGPLESRQTAMRRIHEELAQRAGVLEESRDALRILVEALQVKDEAEASAIFRRLRQGTAVDVLVRHIQHGDVLIQTHALPGARLRFEFPYRKQMPQTLLKANNPFMRSMLYETAFTAPTSIPMVLDGPGDDHAPKAYAVHSAPYTQPYGLASVVDARLDSATPSRWTAVLADDVFLRMLLKLYFQYEHPFMSFFHKDLFLDDMLSGSTTFCSELLVNAVLALACNCCRTIKGRYEFWNPEMLGYKFFAEAKRAWEIEIHNNGQITTVQAAMVLCAIHNLYAMDKVGMSFGASALKLAHGLNVFAAQADMPGTTEAQRRAYTYTAWAMYFWFSVKCHLLCIQPLVTTPPASPLPDPVENQDWYGESWVQYPFHDTLYPLNHPTLFKTKCDLSIVLNHLALSIFNETGQSRPLPLPELKDFLERLGSWHFFLPQPLTPDDIVFPSELNLHLSYYSAILSLVDYTSLNSPLLDFDDDEADDVKQSITHASVCFETLMRLYYLHHGYEIPNSHMTHNLMILVYSSLAQANALDMMSMTAHGDVHMRQEATSALILAEIGLHDQGQNYFLPRALFELVRKKMSAGDREVLDAHLPVQQDSETVESRQRYISSQYPVKLGSRDAALQDPRETHLGHVVNEFVELAAKKIHSISSSRAG